MSRPERGGHIPGVVGGTTFCSLDMPRCAGFRIQNVGGLAARLLDFLYELLFSFSTVRQQGRRVGGVESVTEGLSGVVFRGLFVLFILQH